jgi:hypothetical protein
MDNNSEYSSLLKDERWLTLRERIIKRDNETCRLCGYSYSHASSLIPLVFHVHHVRYVRGKPPWESPEEDLITVCQLCHLVIESLKKENISVLATRLFRNIIGTENVVIAFSQEALASMFIFQGETTFKRFDIPQKFTGFLCDALTMYYTDNDGFRAVNQHALSYTLFNLKK